MFVDHVLLPKLSEEERGIFDPNIYAKARAFRMNGMCKYGDWDRRLVNEPDSELSDGAAVEMYKTRCLEFEWRSFPALIMQSRWHIACCVPDRVVRRQMRRNRRENDLPRDVLSEIVRRVQAEQRDIIYTPAYIAPSDKKPNVERIGFDQQLV